MAIISSGYNELVITRVENGYVVAGAQAGRSCVFEKRDGEPLEAERDLLWFVADYFGFVGSKHDQERITIGIAREKRENEG